MSARAKGEYVQAIDHRYRHAGRPEKRRILDEFCQVAGYHRKHAIRLLNGPAPGAARPPRRRAATYRPAVIEVLRAISSAAGYPWSLRLKALLPLWLPWAKGQGEAARAAADQLAVMLEQAKSMRRGAFAPITQQALIRAILLPLGGVGGVALLDFVMLGKLPF